MSNAEISFTWGAWWHYFDDSNICQIIFIARNLSPGESPYLYSGLCVMNSHKEEGLLGFTKQTDEWTHQMPCNLARDWIFLHHNNRGKPSLLTCAAIVRRGGVLSEKDPVILTCTLMDLDLQSWAWSLWVGAGERWKAPHHKVKNVLNSQGLNISLFFLKIVAGVSQVHWVSWSVCRGITLQASSDRGDVPKPGHCFLCPTSQPQHSPRKHQKPQKAWVPVSHQLMGTKTSNLTWFGRNEICLAGLHLYPDP